MKYHKSLLGFLILTNFIFLFFSIKLFFKENNLFLKKPEFIQQNYSHNILENKTKFNNSVKETFSVGITEKQLIRELAKKGFKPGWSYNNQHQAVFVSSNVVCFSVWSIIWKVNKQGRVTEIDGQYRDGCP